MPAFTTLDAISPIDGRYSKKTRILAQYLSERGLIRHRLSMEVMYLKYFCNHPQINIEFTNNQESFLNRLIDEHEDPESIAKKIETKGHNGIKATNHDVKSIEYLLAYLVKDTSLEKYTNYVHFGLTSEDTTSTAISLMVMRSLNDVMVPTLTRVIHMLDDFVLKYAAIPMLARTHGQPATPTTLGKEFAVFSYRLKMQIRKLKNFSMPTKLNGASGNYNAHVAAYPDVNWIQFSDEYVQSVAKYFDVNLETNLFTTQIESHDGLFDLFSILKHINLIMLDLSNDLWSYISEDWVVQKLVAGEVGSSTMPHKVNPIDFENAEGNIAIANGFFNAFDTLLVSRRQRDLSDSTVLRNIGPAFAHCLISYESMLKGFSKIGANFYALNKALSDNPQILAEPIQTILRRAGVSNAYELLKDHLRGKTMTIESLHEFIDTLSIPELIKQELKSFTPQTYLGNAVQLAKIQLQVGL